MLKKWKINFWSFGYVPPRTSFGRTSGFIIWMVRNNSQYHTFILKITDDISIIQKAEECINQSKSLYDPAYNLEPSDGRVLNRHLLNHERISKQLKDILEDVKNTTIHCLKGVPSLKLTHFSIPLIQIRFHLSKMKLRRLSKASIASRQHKRIPRFFSRGFAASMFQKNENRKRAAANPEWGKRGDWTRIWWGFLTFVLKAQ